MFTTARDKPSRRHAPNCQCPVCARRRSRKKKVSPLTLANALPGKSISTSTIKNKTPSGYLKNKPIPYGMRQNYRQVPGGALKLGRLF